MDGPKRSRYSGGGGGGGGSSMSRDYDNNSYNTYGLSTSFLDSLGINGPLHTKVFVANLDHKVDEKKLKQCFKLAGKVVNLDLAIDKDGNSKGYAVIEYDHPVEAVQAISLLDRQMLYDRRMTVRLDRLPNKTEGIRLPDGLGGIGIGLGPNGEPLRNVAKNLPNQQQSNNMNQGSSSSMNNALAAAATFFNMGSGGGSSSGGGGGGGSSNNNIGGTGNMGGTGMNDMHNLNSSNNMGYGGGMGMGMGGNSGVGNNMGGGTNNNMGSNIGGGGGGGGSVSRNNNMGSGFGNSSFNNGRDDFRNNMQSNFSSGMGGGNTNIANNMNNSRNMNNNATGSDTIVIRNLPISCTWQTLRDKFCDIGEVKFAEIRGNDCGVIRFAKERDAQLAIKLMDGARFDGNTVQVMFF